MAQMAQVLNPLIPTSTPSGMLQNRPASAEAFQSNMSSSQQQQQHNRAVSMPRNLHNQASQQHTNHGYRGSSTAAVPTHAFRSTPSLNSENQRATSSSSSVSQGHSNAQPHSSWDTNRQRLPNTPPQHTSSFGTSSTASWSQTLFSKDDSALSSEFELPPFSTTTTTTTSASSAGTAANSTASTFGIQNTHVDASNAKPSPDRYRRGPRRTDSGSSVPTVQDGESANGLAVRGDQSVQHGGSKNAETASAGGQREDGTQANGSIRLVENSNTATKIEGPASMKRYRRRSQHADDGHKSEADAARPASSAGPSTAGSSTRFDPASGPARSFAEVARRTNNPSPLSRPMSPGESPTKPNAFQNSPAIAAMAALNEKESKKGMSHKLRRAFSFGSSAEMNRRVNEPVEDAASRAQARRDQFSNELDEEQSEIAKQQVAAGLGNNIYSGQAGFIGSTDNISISSTASSASMMLRKMGRGMKKGGRSIKGLFRPKSVVGVPAADGPVASVGPVSMVTVEAEREKVNVNPDPHDQIGGGTGFPRLDRNSIDASRLSTQIEEDSRRSILGGENERAEVLAAVKRGILKREANPVSTPARSRLIRYSGTATAPANGSADTAQQGLSIGRHGSPAPSNDGRTDSLAAHSDDYFAPPRFPNQSTRSLPGTPGSVSRNIKFSPRIVFHDVWSANDYDRRGDIATCNRLTPMLAQQIKEELNTFKMEMEVHELSKPHTHFF